MNGFSSIKINIIQLSEIGERKKKLKIKEFDRDPDRRLIWSSEIGI